MAGSLARKPGPFERELIASFLKQRRDDVRDTASSPSHSARSANGEPTPDDDLPDPDPYDPFTVAASSSKGRRRGPDWAMAQLWRSPLSVAVALRFARSLDAVPGLVDAMWLGSPRVLLDVPDPLALAILRQVWPVLLYGEGGRIEVVSRSLGPSDARRADILALVATEPTKPRDREEKERAFLQALAVAKPVLGLSPDAATFLPAAALRAAEHRLVLAPLDETCITTTVQIVTGRRCRAPQRARLAGLDLADLALADLAIAIRSDRSPAACLADLVRLGGKTPARSGIGRDLSLDQLHGARDAVAWARAVLKDLAAWRAGGPWQDVSSGCLLVGPPGTGKTLLAAVMAAEGDLPLVVGSLPQWQSVGQAHLGTTLKAMREAFEEAKTKAMTGRGRRGAVLLIDEIDSFPDRSKLTHDHRDYVVELVNGLLELLDGAPGREGVLVIGTTNDATRIDPALLRPGRLGQIIAIGFPDLDERVAMLRVRVGDDLGSDLREADLLPVARLTERATGAAIEQLVADARRIARHQDRALTLADLIAVAGQADAERSPELLRRTAIHEAGHAVAAALEIGTDDLVVALQSRDGAAGWVEMAGRDGSAGTRAEIEAAIRVLLAGRGAESVVLGSASAGARQDLVAATTLVANLIGAWGLGETRLLSLGQARPAEILADPGLMDEARLLLDRLYAETCALLRLNRPGLERIAERLLIERRLDGAAVAALIDPPDHRRATATATAPPTVAPPTTTTASPIATAKVDGRRVLP